MLLSLLTGSTPPLPHIPLPPKDPPAIVQKAEVKHKIIKGDSLELIARREHTTVQRLWDKNVHLVNPNLILVNDTIVIPSPDEILVHRPYNTAPKQETPSNSPQRSSPGNLYTAGNCTFYAKSRRPDLSNSLGNADTWTVRAKAQGYATGSEPRAGAIGQKGMHVVYVESVNSDGTFNLSEMNYQSLGVITYRTVSPVGWSFIY